MITPPRWGGSALALALALAVYLAATLPHLGDFPLVDQDEPWIAAPAAGLADEGVYGNDLFAGYYGMERRAMNFPPLFPLTEALAFRLFGVGALQARAVAVFFGAATVALTYLLGRQLYGGAAGALAAWLLVGLRLTVDGAGSGVPFLDLARIARYDIAVPPTMLAALCCFVAAEARAGGPPARRRWPYLAAGALCGLAFLAHVYGGAVVAVIGALLLWRHGPRLILRPEPYLLAAGFALALLPWALFVAQDLASYRGQMLPEGSRLRLWELAFLRESLHREPDRYWRFMYRDREPVLWPRLGIWLVIAGLPLALGALLVRAAGRRGALADRLALIAGPLVAFLLAALVNLKFYNYLVIVLPFGALALAAGLTLAWRAARGRWRPLRAAVALLLGLALLEGGGGLREGLRQAAAASPYLPYVARVAAAVPPGSRVLALHQFWFGAYPRRYEYRSIVMAYYLSDPTTYQPALPMDQALARIDPDYILIDRFMAPALQLDRPADAVDDQRLRLFRRYMEDRGAAPVAQISDPSYGDVTVYRLR